MGFWYKGFHLEETLEGRGEIYELQYFRYKQYERRSPNLQMEKISYFLRTERRLREILQRETSLAVEARQASPERQAEIVKEGEGMKAEYHIAELTIQQMASGFKQGELRRAFDLWRSHPLWYLHKTLIEDCAIRGGCCGRECGCCRNRNPPPNRKLAVGHCTAECLCCQKFRGFKPTKETKKSMRDLFPLNPVLNFDYYRKIMLASIYGITLDSTKSPFDLIDMPPLYEKTTEPTIQPVQNND